MSKAIYRVVDNTTQKAGKLYGVVDGIARKVKKAYGVINGNTRLVFSSGTIVAYPTVALTANSSNGYVVTCSSYNSSSYDGYKAFNKSYSDRYGWASKTRSTDGSPYIQIKMPSAQIVKSVSIANRTFTSVNGVIAATVMGSNDGSSWTTICTISGRDGATSALLTEHECTDTGTAYQYIRVRPTNWNNYNNSTTSNRYVSIGEIYINCLVD